MSRYRMKGPERSQSIIINWASTLDGVRYRFRLAYRERYDCWDIDVQTASGVTIISGSRVVEGYPLFGAFSDARLPPGQITYVDTTGAGQPPTRGDWRSRGFLMYESFTPTVENNELSAVPAPGPPPT